MVEENGRERKIPNFNIPGGLHHNKKIHHLFLIRLIHSTLDKTSSCRCRPSISHALPFIHIPFLSDLRRRRRRRCLSFYGIFNMLLITAAIIDYSDSASFVLFFFLILFPFLFSCLFFTLSLRDTFNRLKHASETLKRNVKKIHFFLLFFSLARLRCQWFEMNERMWHSFRNIYVSCIDSANLSTRLRSVPRALSSRVENRKKRRKTNVKWSKGREHVNRVLLFDELIRYSLTACK